MSLEAFIQKSQRRYERKGPTALGAISKDFAISAVARITSHTPSRFTPSTHVFDREWDVLVILDACRHDMYERHVHSCPSIWSVGGASAEWMHKTFGRADPQELRQTAYITSNPFSTKCGALDDVDLAYLDEVWRDGWDEDLGTVPARPVTDRAIAAARERDYDRLIVHYMQPHYPFIAEVDDEDRPVGAMDRDTFGEVDGGLGLWEKVILGELDGGEVLDAYDANLEYVMEDVDMLLDNIDGKVVISADHGNALGEWGQWGHRPGFPHPGMRQVPWDIQECSDQETYNPDINLDNTSGTDFDDTVSKRLERLGYMDV